MSAALCIVRRSVKAPSSCVIALNPWPLEAICSLLAFLVILGVVF